MRLVEITNYEFNRIEIDWQGPFHWPKGTSAFKTDSDLLHRPGIYRAESLGQNRSLIKYIGSASSGF